MITIPAHIRRCPGDGSFEDGEWHWREGCDDCLQGILRGERLKPHEERQPLALMAPVAGATDGARRRITEPQEILQAAEQLGLFDACRDGGEV